MGIHNLSKLIGDHAPGAIKENEIKSYFGRKIAIDASMSLYQFLIAVRNEGMALTNESGEDTSHLLGMFHRTIRMIDNGIKPVYVFDGKPPQMKSAELGKRAERRDEAQKEHEKAVEAGDADAIDKFSRRLVRVTPQHNEECKRLLKLMGVPYYDAPCEAEAQCAEMVKRGLVFATGTEDMDALTFGSSVLLRHLTFSEAKKMPIKEFHLDKVLDSFEMTQDEFIDLCILLGCDYCGTIRGVGQKRAYDLIKQYKSIENIVKHLDTKKYPVPDNWMFKEARELFRTPEVNNCSSVELKWSEPDEDGLVEFLVKEKQFSEERVRNGAKKLMKLRHGATQGRIDSFFTITTTPNSNKRKSEPMPAKGAKKANTGSGKIKKEK